MAGIAMLGALAVPSAAAAASLTCPTTTTGFDRFYTVDPALACVYGGGEINNNQQPGNDDFLNGAFVTAPNEGIWGGVNTNLILGAATNGAGAGWTPVDYTFGSDPGAGGDFESIPNFDPTLQYLIGIKDGNQSPGWAVFLLDNALYQAADPDQFFWKAVSTAGGNAWSHGVLYSRPGGGGGGQGGGGGGQGGGAPEPATLALFGLAALGAAHRARRRMTE